MSINIIDYKISIIIPIYNVENYLQRCIDSVLSQDFTDWEMILVDDGSPDNCPAICDKNAQNDSRIKVIHKANGGLISARKAGVSIAKGKYVMHLDSDDWLQPKALTILYNQIIKGYDMVRGGAQRITPDGKIIPLERYKITQGEVHGSENFLINIYTGKVAPYLWGALYRADLFDDSVFDESIENRISLGEDVVTNMLVGLKINKVLYIEDIVYNYAYNPNSIMQSYAVSEEYGNRLENLLYKRVISKYQELESWRFAKYASYTLIRCFNPNYGFSNHYDNDVQYLKNPLYADKVRELVPSKYLLFATCKPLYKLYSWIYRKALILFKKRRIKKRKLV